MYKKRTEEDLKEIREMIDLRLQGYSFQEIADKYGVTRQNVRSKIESVLRKDRPLTVLIQRCKYPKLKEWFIDNKCTATEIADNIFDGCYNVAKNKLNGNTNLVLPEIIKIIEYTGETFENLFINKEN